MGVTDESGLRAIKVYIKQGELEEFAFYDLSAHLMQFNRMFGKNWSLTLPKRGKLGAVVGKASDANHLLYQVHVDLILQKCAKPVTVDGIRQCLVDNGEKPSTAKLLAPSYFKLIVHVLNPATKKHRGALVSLANWGQE